MSKKGLFGIALVNVFAIIVLTIILVVFYFLFSMPHRPTTDVISSLQTNKLDFLLINFLRTPREFNGEEINIADLILLQDKDAKSVFKKNAEVFFADCYSNKKWQIDVYDINEEISKKGSKKYDYNSGGYNCDPDSKKTNIAIVNLPLPDYKLVKVVLLECQGDKKIKC